MRCSKQNMVVLETGLERGSSVCCPHSFLTYLPVWSKLYEFSASNINNSVEWYNYRGKRMFGY